MDCLISKYIIAMATAASGIHSHLYAIQVGFTLPLPLTFTYSRVRCSIVFFFWVIFFHLFPLDLHVTLFDPPSHHRGRPPACAIYGPLDRLFTVDLDPLDTRIAVTTCLPPSGKAHQSHPPPNCDNPSTFLFPPDCMYHQLLERKRTLTTQFTQLLRYPSTNMALDPRLYTNIGHANGPGSHSSASSGISAVTGITSPSALSTSASAATLRSTASSPSLRAKESVPVSNVGRQDATAASPGGNVRVVVRVRKFLPRGTFCLLWF